MTYAEVMALIDKGFTTAEIMELSRGNSEPAAAPLPDPEPAPEPEAAAPQDPEPAPAPEPDTLTALRAEIAEIKKTVQANNIKTMSVDTLPTNAETVESVLAGIIRPAYEINNNMEVQNK